ncbi:MAG: MFS transporter [Gammaproteobacteria bacterium]|nr:MFS transporter [Gammaproteobacteria bacterium]
MPTRFDKDPKIDRSLRHSVRDGMAYSVSTGGGETYFSAFALFLQATTSQVALLSTLPPLLGSFGQIVSAWAGQKLGRKPLIVAGAGLQALTWLAILAVPLLFPAYAIVSLLLLLVLYHAAGNLSAPQWTSLMRELVPDRRRGRYFGYRTGWTTIMSFAALLVCGAILHAFDTAGATVTGFVVVFAIAFVARSVSVYHLTFLHETASADATVTKSAPSVRVGEWITHLRSSGAVKFSIYFMLMNLSVAIASPFFAVYVLRDLGFSYLEFMIYAGTSVFVQVLTLNRWGRIADIFGNRLILVATSISIPAVPALWLLSNEFWYLLLAQALAGLSWGGFSLSAGNLLFELLPRTQRAAYVALHNVAAAAAVFIGAMIGAALATWLPAGTAWLGDRAVASSLFYLFAISALARGLVTAFGVRHVPQLRQPRRKISPTSLVLRVTGFNAFVGLWYELIGSGDDRNK